GGIDGQTGCNRSVLFILSQKTKKVPTTNHVSEWSSVPKIIEPIIVSQALFIMILDRTIYGTPSFHKTFTTFVVCDKMNNN
ncbi:hypothetical protein, partial [Weissella confusa]|uniref:hypothetical protein n=1 Tax=Weissella confusa TaxID=1583 RepID=UPI001A7EDB94